MEVIKRNSCAITQAIDFENLYTFRQFPVFMGSTKQPENDDLKADMTWMISKSSGLIQLGSLLPLDILYPESHGSGSVGAIWNQHHRSFAKFILQFSSAGVFEIGGLHGILAHEYSKVKDIPWTILEPNPAPIPGCHARFIKGFFDEKFKYSEPFDMVVHSHLFEHIYEPSKFMSQLADFMDDGKYLIFSIPNMQIMLERKYNNCINFEHTMFLTEPYVDYLLANHGFRLAKKVYFMDDHSIFYAAVRDKTTERKDLPNELYEKNKKLYQDYLLCQTNLIAELNSKMHLAGQEVYLFGAHVFAQYLLAFGLDTTCIKGLLDNDSNKHGKRLYGSAMLVNSPKILKDENSPIVILKAGVYNDEIMKDILENVNPNVIFWE